MQQVLIVIHLIVVLALVGVILLQRSEGGALGGLSGGGGVSGFLTGRGQANALTRATAILAAVFFTTSMALAIMAGLGREPKSIFDRAAPIAPAGSTAPAAPSGSGGVLDQLRQLEGQGSGGQAPARQP
ncbi:preprotein translocase subunit SecG [Alsobacter sp. R-9]